MWCGPHTALGLFSFKMNSRTKDSYLCILSYSCTSTSFLCTPAHEAGRCIQITGSDKYVICYIRVIYNHVNGKRQKRSRFLAFRRRRSFSPSCVTHSFLRHEGGMRDEPKERLRRVGVNSYCFQFLSKIE